MTGAFSEELEKDWERLSRTCLRVKAERDELLLACKLMVEWEESYRTINNLGTIPPSPFQIAIATIAQVEERQ